MTLNEFIEKLSLVFETTSISLIKADTDFKQLEEWDSMIALSLIAMVDNEYNLKLTGEDIRNSNTVEELFNKVKVKS